MVSVPGGSTFIIGAMLLAPLVFFGLGMVGVGDDYLTGITGHFLISKMCFGIATFASIVCLVSGYTKMSDGKVV